MIQRTFRLPPAKQSTAETATAAHSATARNIYRFTISSRAEKAEITSLTTSSRCAPSAMEPLTDASPRLDNDR